MNPSMKKIAPVCGLSAALFGAHLWENAAGFDPTTGLTVPTPAHYAVIALVVIGALFSLVSCRSLPRTCPAFAEHFSAPEKSTLLPVLGGLLFIAGGALLGYTTIQTQGGIAPLVTAALAFATGCGIVVLTKQLRDETADSVVPLLPAMFFGAFWVLSLYLPAASDPVLTRYWLPILAAAAAAYAFAQLAGFFRGETKVRTFGVTARLAVILCVGAAAELQLAHTLLYLSCAMVLCVFLGLEKE